MYEIAIHIIKILNSGIRAESFKFYSQRGRRLRGKRRGVGREDGGLGGKAEEGARIEENGRGWIRRGLWLGGRSKGRTKRRLFLKGIIWKRKEQKGIIT